jgi:diadenylate cyclase
VIVKGERVRAAGCVFPLTQRQMLDRSIGLRHRAGLGITEETDAIAVIISEETGQISLCHSGKIEQNIKPGELAKRLDVLLGASSPVLSPKNEPAQNLPA